ncbi:hypothetical protein VNO77_13598 [Canavalia gladiata]|uniref:Uncharacterized protein n=1 Tax=Canavalia gladiata TaxID=3824 RepID=A0AAN9LXG9_CANGL
MAPAFRRVKISGAVDVAASCVLSQSGLPNPIEKRNETEGFYRLKMRIGVLKYEIGGRGKPKLNEKLLAIEPYVIDYLVPILHLYGKFRGLTISTASANYSQVAA